MEFELAERQRNSGDPADSILENQTGEIQRHYPRHQFIAYLLTFCTVVQLIVSTFLLFIGTESLILEFIVNALSLISTVLVIQWLEGRSRLNENIRLIDSEIKDRVDTSIICGLAVFQSIWVSVDLFGIAVNWTEFILSLKGIFTQFDTSSWFDNDMLDLIAISFLSTKAIILVLYLYFLRLSFRTLRTKNDFANLIATNGVLILVSGTGILIGITTLLFCIKYPLLANVVPSSWISMQFFFSIVLFCFGFHIIYQSKFQKGSARCLAIITTILLFLSIAITKYNFDYAKEVDVYYSGITDPVEYKHISSLIHEDEYKLTTCPDKYLSPQTSCYKEDLVIRWESLNDTISYRCLNMTCSAAIGDLFSRGFYTLSDSSLFSSMSILAALFVFLTITAIQHDHEYKMSETAQNIFVAFGLAAAFVFCAASLSEKKVFMQTNHNQVEGVYIQDFMKNHTALSQYYQDFRFKEIQPDIFFDYIIDEYKYVTVEVTLEQSDDFDMEIHKIGGLNSTFADFVTDLKSVKSGVAFGGVNLYVENIKTYLLVTYISPNKTEQALSTIKARTKVNEASFPTSGNFTLIGADGNLGYILTSEESSLDLEFILHQLQNQFNVHPSSFEMKPVSYSSLPVSKSYDPEHDYSHPVFNLPESFDPQVVSLLNNFNNLENAKAVEIYLNNDRDFAIAKSVPSYLNAEVRRALIIYTLFEYEDFSQPIAIVMPKKEPAKTSYVEDFVQECIENAISVVELEDSDSFEMSSMIKVGVASNPGARIKISEDYLNNIQK